MIVFAINSRKVYGSSKTFDLWIKTDTYAFQEEKHVIELFKLYFDSTSYDVSFTKQAHNEFRKILLPNKQIVIDSRLELGDFLSEGKGILQNSKRNIVLTLVNHRTEKNNGVEEVIVNSRNFQEWYKNNYNKTLWYDKKLTKWD